MAIESNDLAMLHSMGFSPYEQVKIGYMQEKSNKSGLGIAGLTVGVGAGVLALGMGAWAASRAQNAKDVAIAKNDGLRDLVATLANTVAAERNERIDGDRTLSISINDTVSGQQQGNLTASQQAVQTAEQTVLTGLMTGQYSENPQKVMLYSAPQPCGCPCSCNG